jgi:hypothetical protein
LQTLYRCKTYPNVGVSVADVGKYLGVGLERQFGKSREPLIRMR